MQDRAVKTYRTSHCVASVCCSFFSLLPFGVQPSSHSSSAALDHNKEDLSESSWKETAVSLSLWERLTWLLSLSLCVCLSSFIQNLSTVRCYFPFIPKNRLNIFCRTDTMSIFFLLIIHNIMIWSDNMISALKAPAYLWLSKAVFVPCMFSYFYVRSSL